MRDRRWVIIGLAIFLLLVSFPVWYTAVAGSREPREEPELPANETECVEAKAFMTAHHMELLDQWRDAVVREGKKTYTSDTGKEYEMSLTRTCMGCHKDRETFCLRCHTYANVEPYCWDCHLEAAGE